MRTAAAALDGFTGETSARGGVGVGKVGDTGATGDGALAGMGDIVERVFHTQGKMEKESEQDVKARVMEAAAVEVAAAAKAYSGGTVSALKEAHDALMVSSPPPTGQTYNPPQPPAMESDSASTSSEFELIENGLRLHAYPPHFPPPRPSSPSEASNTAAAAAISEEKGALATAIASDKVTSELSAELNETMAKAKTTARALDKLNDITAEVIGAMATKNKYGWEVSSAVARARSRLYDVKSVLNTTAETDSVLTLTLNKLQEEKEIQAAEVLRAAVEAASKAGAQGHDVNEFLTLLESIEIESKSLSGRERDGTDTTAAVTMKVSLDNVTDGANAKEKHLHRGHHGGLGIEEGMNGSDSFNAKKAVPEAAAVAALSWAGPNKAAEIETIYGKVASMAKKAAEKAVETEVKAVMAKAETKSDTVVERAAEIARQLALGDMMSQDPPDTTAAERTTVTTASAASSSASGSWGNTEDILGNNFTAGGVTAVTLKEVGVGVAEEDGSKSSSTVDKGSLDTLSSPVLNAQTATAAQRTYVPLLDSNFYRSKGSDAYSSSSSSEDASSVDGSNASLVLSKPSMNWGSEMQKYITKVKSKLHRSTKRSSMEASEDSEGDITPFDDSGYTKLGLGVVKQGDASATTRVFPTA